MATHILYSHTRSQGGNLYAYHLPKAYLHVQLFREADGQHVLSTHPHFLPDPVERFHLQYQPEFTAHDTLHVSFQKGGYLQHISTEKKYPDIDLQSLGNTGPGQPIARSAPSRSANPATAILQFEQFIDPFKTEEVISLNKQLASFDPKLGLNIAPMGPKLELPSLEKESTRPGVWCRPTVAIVIKTQQGATTTEQLWEVPDGRQRQFIEVPPSQGTQASLDIFFDEWGVPTKIDLDKSSSSWAWFQLLKSAAGSLLGIVGQIFTLRVNRYTHETEANRARLAHRQAQAQLAQFERQAQQAEVRAQAAEALLQQNQLTLQQQQRQLAQQATVKPVLDSPKAPAEQAEEEPKPDLTPLPPGTEELKSFEVQLQVVRYAQTETQVLGMLVDVTKSRKPIAFTREVAIPNSEQAFMPAGTYPISLRDKGGLHRKFAAQYGDTHKGLLEIQEGIGRLFIFPANANKDEQGSLLLEPEGKLGEGRTADNSAYLKVYPMIAEALEAGKTVGIQYLDLPEAT